MSLKNDGECHEEQYNNTTTTPQSSSDMTRPLLSRDNPISLAAISNYKLAQLTFSAPDWNSMRKTALIKNMTDVIYNDTPPEWFDQMRRWQFFTPESLSDMTQDGLELIFGQYIQTMEAFKPINLNDNDDDDDEYDDDDDDDEFWPEDEILTPNDLQPTLYENGSTSTTEMPMIMEYPLYAHSGASLSAELLAQKDSKPLPDRPFTPTIQTRTTTASEKKQQHRKSMAKMRNRLSWTSDTGLLANSAMGQNWANELMTMFNMEFQVDTSLHLNTTTVTSTAATAMAPMLPEFPFSARHNPQQKRQSHRKSQRYSTDSFMNLIPAFESFKLEEPVERRPPVGSAITRSKTINFPPPPPTTPPPHLMAGSITSISSRQRSSSQPEMYQQQTNTPKRSSSLKIKSRSRSRSASGNESSSKSKSSTDILLNGLVNTFSGSGGTSSPGEKRTPLSKKKSIRRLVSLISTKSKNDLGNEHHKTNKRQSTPTPTNSASILSSAATAATIINKTSLPSNIYHTHLPSSTHSSAPLDSGNSTSQLSTISSSLSSSSSGSTHSMLMVATKTTILHHKPLPDIPSTSMTENHDNNKKGHQRRTSYTVARPVIVELTDLRRSRSAGHRPIKRKNSFKWKNDDIPPPLPPTLPPTPTPPEIASVSTEALTSLPSYILSDSPMNINNLAPRPKRSKSTLMKISNGLSKGHKKLLLARKNDSVATKDMADNNNNFVKRMASFGKRMKLQRV